MNRLFIFTVVLPTVLSILYFGFIDSDVYISESRFVLRSPEPPTTSPLGIIFKGSGFSRSQDDTYTVQDYILSRDALNILNEKLGLRKVFANPHIDIFNRFAGLDGDTSFEALYRYYKTRVTIQLDSGSSICTVIVRAFSPDDALHINRQLLDISEALVNQLNERGRQDMIHFAAAEVETAEHKAKNAALALSRYRNDQGVIDPERQSTLQLQQIARLQEELFAAQAQLQQLQTFVENNPQIPPLQQRIENLRRGIALETGRVAGSDRSLANQAAEYQRLALDLEFSDKQLGSALASLEQARNEAQRKQLYLERIVEPNRPDQAMEPRRLRSIIATCILGMISWGILTILVAGVREHNH